MAKKKQYWLMKSEPDVFGIDNLQAMGSDHWDGVRNPVASKYMREEMRVGDDVLIYHSNAKPSGVAGLAKVSSEPYPDHTAFDESSKYYDAKSDPDKPRWFMVNVSFEEKFPGILSLHTIKDTPALSDMVLVRNSRLSIQRVEADEFALVCKMARAIDPDAEPAAKKKARKPAAKKKPAGKQSAATKKKPVAKKKKAATKKKPAAKTAGKKPARKKAKKKKQ